MNRQKALVAARFAAAAAGYEAASTVQQAAAQRLAERVCALALPPAPRVLEIGCGTGGLTRRLQPVLGGRWILSDVALNMLRHCRAAAGSAMLVMDGEYPALRAGSVDVIVSNLAAQWFEDLPRTLRAWQRLLAPGGWIACSTLGGNSFAQWRAAHAAGGQTPTLHRYPQRAQLAAWLPAAGLSGRVEEECLRDEIASPLDFLRRLRAIGADARPAHTHAYSPGALRAVLRRLDARAGMDYHLLFVLAQKT